MNIIPFPNRNIATANRRELPRWMTPAAIAARASRIREYAESIGCTGPRPLVIQGSNR